jgi:putative transcriptional regulator
MLDVFKSNIMNDTRQNVLNTITMTTAKLKPAKGMLLISEPKLSDFYFNRSVVLLADHNDEGSFGLIINKPTDLKLSDISDDFAGINTRLFIGGPVKTDSIYFIHTRGDLVTGSSRIMEGLYWGGQAEELKNLILKKKISEDEIRFFIGYAGWKSGQLNDEYEAQAWISAVTTSHQVLHTEPTGMWRNLLKSLGKEYAMWVNYPADPTLN